MFECERSSLYITNLHGNVTDAMLHGIFSAAGPVLSVRVCMNADTKLSLGCAYVNFQNPADADHALNHMNFHPIMGKSMRIMWAESDPSRRVRGPPEANLYISNLWVTTDKELYDLFAPFGTIISAKVALDKYCRPYHHGFVQFESVEVADFAMSMTDGMPVKGFNLSVCKVKQHREQMDNIMGHPEFMVNSKKRGPPEANLYVKKLARVNDQQLHELFRPYGNILSCKVALYEDGRSKGHGFVQFETVSEADRAMKETNRMEVNGKKLYVRKLEDRSKRTMDIKRQKAKTKLRLERRAAKKAGKPLPRRPEVLLKTKPGRRERNRHKHNF